MHGAYLVKKWVKVGDKWVKVGDKNTPIPYLYSNYTLIILYLCSIYALIGAYQKVIFTY